MNELFPYAIMLRLAFTNFSMASGLEFNGGYLGRPSIRILLVDDYELWRRFVQSTLQEASEFELIGEASDGWEAVQKAEQLQPDLILLDIGLPKQNGIVAARRIRERSPKSKILFCSENRSSDIVEEALRTGALGYLVKSDGASELLPALEAVLQGKQFLSASVSAHRVNNHRDEHTTDHASRKKVAPLPPHNPETVRHHEVLFHSDDRQLLDEVSQFIGSALKARNAAIVIATDSHRESLIARLSKQGLDIAAAIEQGRYIALDAADALPMFMLNGMPDPIRFLKLLGDLIVTTAGATKGEQVRVAIFGEMCRLLWAQGNAEAAIQVEKLGNQLAKIYDLDILCGYSLNCIQAPIDSQIFQRICAEHTAVHSY